MESLNASLGEEKMKQKGVISGGINNATLVDVPEIWSF